MKYADNSFVSEPGCPIKVIYAPKVKDNGGITIMAAGTDDVQARIDSYCDSCEIGTIVSRFQNTGDPSVLQQRPGAYGDFTSSPSSLAEALQLQIDSNRLYDSLPVEIKQKFDNDRNQFFAQSGTADWFEKMDSVLPESMRIIKPGAGLQPVEPPKEVNE